MSNLVRTNGESMAKNKANRLSISNWSSWIDEVFNSDLPSSFFNSNFNMGMTLPKVNIRDTKDAYFVEMAVPGLKKSDFHIDLDNQILSISTEMGENDEQQKDNHIRREFGYASFKRSFSLPETINEDKIKGEYIDGMLSIYLPKKEETIQKSARSIKIS